MQRVDEHDDGDGNRAVTTYEMKRKDVTGFEGAMLRVLPCVVVILVLAYILGCGLQAYSVRCDAALSSNVQTVLHFKLFAALLSCCCGPCIVTAAAAAAPTRQGNVDMLDDEH